MPSLPAGWKLRQQKRSDGRVDIVGTDARGEEYLARTTEGEGVTDRDLQLLSVGNRETTNAREFVKFYENERAQCKKTWERSMDNEYGEAAEQVVHAGLHLSESSCGAAKGNLRNYHRGYEAWMKSLEGVN